MRNVGWVNHGMGNTSICAVGAFAGKVQGRANIFFHEVVNLPALPPDRRAETRFRPIERRSPLWIIALVLTFFTGATIFSVLRMI